MKPLGLIKVPVHELAMMMSIALRFIPTLIGNRQDSERAKGQGADFSSGNIVRRAKALIPILVPLVSAFRRRQLAMAMECRCYHGGKGRTGSMAVDESGTLRRYLPVLPLRHCGPQKLWPGLHRIEAAIHRNGVPWLAAPENADSTGNAF